MLHLHHSRNLIFNSRLKNRQTSRGVNTFATHYLYNPYIYICVYLYAYPPVNATVWTAATAVKCTVALCEHRLQDDGDSTEDGQRV